MLRLLLSSSRFQSLRQPNGIQRSLRTAQSRLFGLTNVKFNNKLARSLEEEEPVHQSNEEKRKHYKSNSGNKFNDKKQSKNTTFNYSNGFKTLAASGIITYTTYRNTSSNFEPPINDKPILIEELQQAIITNDERRVRILLNKCTPDDVNARHLFGWQMLHLAAVHGRYTICELLLQNGAKVNDIDQYSLPRLMEEKLNINHIIIALTRGEDFSKDLDHINFYGFTPLHYAAYSNSLETVEMLLKYGANPTIKSQSGHKASRFANAQIAKYIENYEEEYIRREKELEQEERRKYPLEQRIKEHLVGQDAAISMVAATIRRKENGWIDEDHPLVFLFLGSSGIGKTELAKQIAKYLHKNDQKAFIRLDMSEYQEQHSVARMIGAPPGYVGHQDGGQLTDALKSCPGAVVLFDEVEKAHPKVLTVLLQLFDEGRLTDGKGKTIECKNAIFIMTSNLASETIAEHAMQLRAEQQAAREIQHENKLRGLLSSTNTILSNDEDYQEKITISRKFKDTIVRPVLKAHFQRDEFLGRINEMVYFLPFSDCELKQLVVKELEFWAAKAKKKNSLLMTWDDRVVDLICKGYDVHYGARSIKHEVERRIINQISELYHAVKNAKKVHISVNSNPNNEVEELINIKIN